MARKEVHGNILKSMVSGLINFPEVWLPRLGGGLTPTWGNDPRLT